MINQGIIGDMLQSHGLRRTIIRTQILELFMKNSHAMSAADLLEQMDSSQDRVTVYRALTSFEKKGILHKASEDGQGIKYALCNHSCPDESHTEKHAHFVCDECHHTYCLEKVTVPEINLSDSFKVNAVNYTLSGICKDCNI